ncbi:MAG: TlpA family protein disulfide reductase [Bacteroidia bacterium]|jgi:thiol-disulfide isomerase/thioredoxin|nr:TlpA family protein disulfide reductase [Bacteroidia bacterium]
MRIKLLWLFLGLLVSVGTLFTFPSQSSKISFCVPFILAFITGYFYKSGKSYSTTHLYWFWAIPVCFLILVYYLNQVHIFLLIPEIIIAWILGFTAGYIVKMVSGTIAKTVAFILSLATLLLITFTVIPSVILYTRSSEVAVRVNLPKSFYIESKRETISTPGKVVILDFWNTGCGPCYKQQPIIKSVHNRFQNNTDVVFVAVNIDHDSIRATPSQIRVMTSPIWHDSIGNLTRQFRITSVPVIAVIDREGVVRWVIKGFNSDIESKLEDVLIEQIERCLSF